MPGGGDRRGFADFILPPQEIGRELAGLRSQLPAESINGGRATRPPPLFQAAVHGTDGADGHDDKLLKKIYALLYGQMGCGFYPL